MQRVAACALVRKSYAVEFHLAAQVRDGGPVRPRLQRLVEVQQPVNRPERGEARVNLRKHPEKIVERTDKIAHEGGERDDVANGHPPANGQHGAHHVDRRENQVGHPAHQIHVKRVVDRHAQRAARHVAETVLGARLLVILAREGLHQPDGLQEVIDLARHAFHAVAETAVREAQARPQEMMARVDERQKRKRHQAKPEIQPRE